MRSDARRINPDPAQADTSTTGWAGWSSGSSTWTRSSRCAARPSPIRAGQHGEAVREAEKTLETAVRAIQTYAGVVKDRSDRTAIVLLNAYVYRPLRSKLAE